MRKRHRVLLWRLLGGVLLMILGSIGKVHNVKAEPAGTLTTEQQQIIQEEVRNAVRQAEILREQGSYAEALRILFDALEQESILQVERFLQDPTKEVSLLTLQAMEQLEQHLFREDHSPLMQWFRDPDVPLQEKHLCLLELRQFAEQSEQGENMKLFRDQYTGQLVQLMSSSLLTLGEKTSVLSSLRQIVQTDYTSPSQQEHIKKDITRLQQEADLQFHAQQYVAAFLLIDEANQKARELDLSDEAYIDLLKQKARMRTEFVYTDRSPLMLLFKSNEIPTKEKQYLLYDLRKKVGNVSQSHTETLAIQGKHYDGTFVEILLHPQIHWMTKDGILVTIDAGILQKEPGYVPEVFLGLEDYLKKQENLQEEEGSTKDTME